MSVELESKFASKMSNDEKPTCVQASVGSICESSTNKFMRNVLVDIEVLDAKIARTVFRDRGNDNRWDLTKVPGFMGQRNPDAMSQFEVIGFKETSEENFSFSMKDFQTGETIFDTTKRSLIMSDKYLEIGFVLPSQILFGLGQHNSQFLLTEGNWTMFNRDRSGSPVATGKGSQQTYGTHPFLMSKTQNNKFIGILFYNSNAQEVNINFSSSDKSVITYRTVGGMLDIYYFMAGTADEVIQNYNNLIGKPTLPPFWAMGFHQCSWLYNSTDDLRTVVQNYTNSGFLFDTIWTDIPYMHNYVDFSVNQTSHGDIKDFINDLHSKNMHFVPIIDAGISIESDAKGTNWFTDGQKRNVFIKSLKNPDMFNGTLMGHVWPNHTAFVDFMHPNSSKFWTDGLDYLYDQMPFDGIWLDMNEPSNSCVDKEGNYIGECPPQNTSSIYQLLNQQQSEAPFYSPNITVGEFDEIPYSPEGEPLFTRTISMDGYHYDESGNSTFIQYNTHNLFGTQETMATSKYLQGDTGKKPFLISRDSFVGHGQYGSVWTGDNSATQEDMKLSINQIMQFNMFGIPFVGGDICGFADNTTPELCARWAQVGAFYPFMRNHYAHKKNPQEFYRFDEPYQSGMKQSLRQRYSLIKYMYTLLLQSAVDGTPTVRHLMYDYPDIKEMVYNQDSFMIGKHVRITANFDNSTTPQTLKSFFPKGTWVDYNTYDVIQVIKKVEEIELYNGWNYTNVHVKGGSVVPFQDASAESGIKNTNDLVTANLKLLIVPNDGGYAEGDVWLAKGELMDEPYQYFTFIHSEKVILFKFNGGDRSIQEKLDEIHIVGNSSITEADFICGKDIQFNAFNLKLEKVTHPVSNTTFLRITSADSSPLLMNNILSISYGKAGVDYNFCDKSYIATKDHETQFELGYKLTKKNATQNEATVIVTVQLISDNTVEVKITDDSGTRFEVPKEALSQEKASSNDITRNIHDFVIISSDKFTLTVHEYQQPNNVYFKIDDNSLILSEYFLSLDTQINTNGYLYGLGERVTEFFIKEGIYTTWSRDIPDPYDDGKWPGNNIYGSHPVYFTRAKSGNKYHWGMLNLNANAQDTRVQYSGSLGGQVSHYISGQGVFDLYFFLDHIKPEDVVKNYHTLIGFPLLPPFYSVGWNQCRYGYKSTDELKGVYQNYSDHDFPLDNLWSDIDYMYKYRDFTYDKNGSYAGLDSFVRDTLHKNNKHYVPIIDAGIAIIEDGTYPTFERGKNKGAYILSGNQNQNDEMDNIFYGKVWPGYAAFPDFTKKETNDWWLTEVSDFHNQLNFDGLWLDMNEASNFCSGACVDKDIVPSDKSVNRKITYIPGSNKLEDKSMSLDARHSDGQNELNYHSLFGFMQGIPSHKFFTDNNRRPFIIARSTFVGQGKYTSHWLGDNFSGFDYLKYSIPGVYSMNLFGVNFAGSDICGFIGDTTPNLCEKWTVLGAFYPFARNHNAINQIDQEPYVFSEDIQANMRRALRWRYALMRYYYTQMYINSIEGGMFWKPLFIEFPEDSNTYDNLERNIMIGPALKLSPMIDEKDAKTQNFIFPEGIWCDIVSTKCTFYHSTTTSQSLPTTPDAINLHLRMGHILPIQREATEKVMSSADLDLLQTSLMSKFIIP